MDWAKTADISDEQKSLLIDDAVNTFIENKDVPIDATFDSVVKKAVIRTNPELSSHKDVPNMVISKDSQIKFVFPKTTNIYPNRIFNPATGQLESNPEVNPK